MGVRSSIILNVLIVNSAHCFLMYVSFFGREGCTYSICSTFSQVASRFSLLDSVKQPSLAGESVSS